MAGGRTEFKDTQLVVKVVVEGTSEIVLVGGSEVGTSVLVNGASVVTGIAADVAADASVVITASEVVTGASDVVNKSTVV